MGGLGRPIFQTIPNLFRIQSPQAPFSSGPNLLGPAVAFAGRLNRLGWNAYQTRKGAMFRFFGRFVLPWGLASRIINGQDLGFRILFQ